MTLRVALAQINPTVGDLAGNAGRIVAGISSAKGAGAHLVAFPELAVTAYPPEDLVLKAGFVSDTRAAVDEVADAARGIVAVVGFVEAGADGRLHNSAAICRDGAVAAVYRKRRLPNYSVFDEARYFAPGEGAVEVHELEGVRFGVTVCEDAWAPGGPIAEIGAEGADLVININASPYHRHRVTEREAEIGERAREAGCSILYVNQVGGQDELVFDGASMALAATGEVVARSPQFAEHLLIVDVEPGGALSPAADDQSRAWLDPLGELWEALVLGTRDYAHKNGFSDAVLGLSGGIDSSLVAVIAADALGHDHVHTVALPSRYSSEHSLSDAADLADRVGTDHRIMPIEEPFAAMLGALEPAFAGKAPDVTEENLQARIRGTLLKSLENKHGWLLLTTGNKSEMAVGYATLYGDMNGGYNPIKDVFKTTVFELARWRNERAEAEGRTPPIPESVITKPPSAELRPDQTDQDTLPPYHELDEIIELYVEDDRTVAEVVAHGYDEGTVRRIARMVEVAEHKRRQAPPGPRISPKAFGKDRRMPITNRYPG